MKDTLLNCREISIKNSSLKANETIGTKVIRALDLKKNAYRWHEDGFEKLHTYVKSLTFFINQQFFQFFSIITLFLTVTKIAFEIKRHLGISSIVALSKLKTILQFFKGFWKAILKSYFTHLFQPLWNWQLFDFYSTSPWNVPDKLVMCSSIVNIVHNFLAALYSAKLVSIAHQTSWNQVQI